ncbi:uncharacterized protein BDZ99DRAFT_572261 [Mytilinidion resinicola]|uniref:Uncharacterized protein n=1 Tax=Mytilinidion resinicola TaxID=574789 RepID=A0A6A6YHY5_9PEZI|nr:uncharacterized protein BDZ99DRAFT_572261 [Mytilinidion resinicola]KAF2808390.1 hypothetical protein BDZ99DRAFT_572261 [Mytilinidion resinicola]
MWLGSWLPDTDRALLSTPPPTAHQPQLSRNRSPRRPRRQHSAMAPSRRDNPWWSPFRLRTPARPTPEGRVNLRDALDLLNHFIQHARDKDMPFQECLLCSSVMSALLRAVNIARLPEPLRRSGSGPFEHHSEPHPLFDPSRDYHAGYDTSHGHPASAAPALEGHAPRLPSQQPEVHLRGGSGGTESKQPFGSAYGGRQPFGSAYNQQGSIGSSSADAAGRRERVLHVEDVGAGFSLRRSATGRVSEYGPATSMPSPRLGHAFC